ncbi:hypothetical protein JCM19236_2930 [Vibrio sp. JCM 19236]|nr:hypothetical protein JCM19236_2930 [Vibrio sp. JCM 19236]
MNRHALLALACLSSFPTVASFEDPVDGRFDIGEHLAENAYGFLLSLSSLLNRLWDTVAG